MSAARKKQLLSQMFVAGNLKEDYSLWLAVVLYNTNQKYRDLSKEDFSDVCTTYGESRYFEEVYKLFDETFTEEEIEQLLNFWSSPVGRKLVKGDFHEKQKVFHLRWARAIDAACQERRISRQEGTNDPSRTS